MARGLVTGGAGSLRVARQAPFPQTGVPLMCPGAMPPNIRREGFPDLRLTHFRTALTEGT